MRVFHGTSLEFAKTMINNNFNPEDKESYTWSCSDDYDLYVYPIDKIKKEIGDDEDESDDNAFYESIRRAFESARITAACHDSKYSELVVIELDIPDELLEDDWSCENMSDVASSVHLSQIDVSMVKSIHVDHKAYSSMLRAPILIGVYKMNYFNTEKLTDNELEILDKMSGVDFSFLHDDDFDYEMMTVEEFKHLGSKKIYIQAI